MSSVILAMMLGLPQAAPDVVVVCPEPFRQALRPWVEHRTAQGHRIAIVSNLGTADQVRGRIRDVAAQGKLRFVVLVGDAELGMDDDPQLRTRCVPIHQAKAEVNVQWGSEPTIATDNWYADLDGDRVPDVAVGRLTADTPGELTAMVRKVLAYERSRDFGPWRRRLNFVAGVGGFNPLVDMVLESSARYFLTRDVPAGYAVSMTYGSWRSPYCPDPRLFHLSTVDRLNEGSWFWVYIGHGHHLGLDRVRVPGSLYHILDVRDVKKLTCPQPRAPIALFLACYTGAIDARDDCLAERMLRTPGAPVAAVAGSRVTMPYAMGVLATELMDQCFREQRPTLGEALLRAKQKLVKGAGDDQRRKMLDAVASAISPAPSKLAAERAEHVLLFNLIGDPLLRLHHAKAVRLEVPAAATAGGALEVAGTSPVDGRCRVELVVPRGRLTFKPKARPQYPQTAGELAELQEVYQRANDPRLAAAEVLVQGGRFRSRLDVPPEARGDCRVRVFVEGADDFALGAATVKIEPPRAATAVEPGHGEPTASRAAGSGS